MGDANIDLLEQLRALLAKTTKGPWEVGRDTISGSLSIVSPPSNGDDSEIIHECDSYLAEHDAAIAALHNAAPTLLALAEDALKLRAAIAEHARQNLDDRCWLDDAKLYAAAGIEADGSLPPHDQFMKHCEHYSRCRRNGTEYDPRYAITED